jgi:hypothetical protein
MEAPQPLPPDAGSPVALTPEVLFIEDVARVLRTSPTTERRLEMRSGTNRDLAIPHGVERPCFQGPGHQQCRGQRTRV